MIQFMIDNPAIPGTIGVIVVIALHLVTGVWR